MTSLGAPAPSWPDRLRVLGVTLPRNRKVLVVDDERGNLDVLRALLEEEFEVMVADSGPRAQALLAAKGPVAVVIADQRMPGMTGVELLADVWRRTPNTVRMVLTAFSDIAPIIDAPNEGAVYRYFLKPWNSDELRAAVRDGIELYAAKSALQHLVAQLAKRRDELSQAIDKLRRSERELLAAERMSTLGRFTSGITHNIRNSLTVMMNLLEIVQQSPGELAVLRAAQTAFGSLDALLRLVSDVNALARGELGSAKRSVVETGAFVEQTLALFRLEAAGRDRGVKVLIDEEARVLRFDPLRVRQALLALLRNAAEASAARAPIEVGVTLETRDGHARFEIRDRGHGMAGSLAEDASRPFGEPHQTPTVGLGIGLELVRVVAAAHGGRLLVVSSRGRGTTAQLTLAHADPDADEPPAGAGP
jgi:signal transduction histidine kinase